MALTVKLISRKSAKAYDDVDQMCRKLSLQPISDEERDEIIRLSRRGDTVYIAVNPLSAQIYDTQSLIMGTDEDEVYQRQCEAAEEI